MKKFLLTFIALVFASAMIHAQKFAYVDTKYILDNIPEYSEAQAQLEELSAQWQKEIEAKFDEVEKMYQNYQVQSVLLPEEMKTKKEQEIVDAEKEAKTMQRDYFGKDGELFKKRQELVKPIQEKIYNAIQQIAEDNNYSVVFDKAGSLTMMYANPKYDVSDDVLDQLGAAMGSRTRSQSSSGSGGSGGTGDSGGKQRK
ncbi:MAG: OmpH family outer membrane protein [Bacteroidales bacterium]|nr:OmpH family outer membrane protein [Bacteroidales bacterium]